MTDTLRYTRGCCIDKNTAGETVWSECVSCQKLAMTDCFCGKHNAALPSDVVEIRFKNTRKAYFKTNDIVLKKGDVVAVESTSGHDIGMVSLTGDLVYLQMQRNHLDPANYDYKKVYRKAKPADVEKWNEAVEREQSLMVQTRRMVEDLHLNMKIGDVEIYGDKTKAIFYYVADDRVDFRELIKIMAEEFKLRIEMRQIGARQEAGRIGGIAICGRELCCSLYLPHFASVSTNAARDQDLSTNLQRLAGQCGKLKCCLNYELSTYTDARKDFPQHYASLEMQDGTAYHHKTDIFKRLMWYNFDKESMENLVPISVDRVIEILTLNKEGKKAADFGSKANIAMPVAKATHKEPDYRSAVGEDSITRFDRQKNNHRKKSRHHRPERADNSAPRPAGANNGNGNGAPSQRNRRRHDRRPASNTAPKPAPTHNTPTT